MVLRKIVIIKHKIRENGRTAVLMCKDGLRIERERVCYKIQINNFSSSGKTKGQVEKKKKGREGGWTRQ